jgi:NAD(P)H-dependent FMN reductase
MFIPVILGTAREGAQSAKVANYILKKAEEYGFETELVKAGDYIEAQTKRVGVEGNPKAESWKAIVERAEGMIIVVPEYNHSFPGELKLLLDSLYKEYYGKTVGLVGVSNGGLGGARVVENIKTLINNFGMIATQRSLLVSKVQDVFDETGNLKDESYNEKAIKLLDEVKWFAGRLKGGK